MDNWNKIFKPIVVLACICIVVTTALALTNQATAPIIAQLAAEAADAARKELMPDAPGYEQVSFEMANVQDVYKATDDSGYIITSTSKGYGGSMIIMTAFDSSGNIIRIKVQSHAETKGIGDKVEADSFWGQYSGLAAQALGLDVDIDKVSGATISSRAVNNAVNTAIEAYNAVATGVTSVKTEEPTGTAEEILFQNLGLDFDEFVVVDIDDKSVEEAYAHEDGSAYVILTGAEGHKAPIVLAVAFDEKGAVTKVHVVDCEETEAKGELLANESFLKQFEGVKEPIANEDIDVLSGATNTSEAVNEAMTLALEAFEAVSAMNFVEVEDDSKDEVEAEEVEEAEEEEIEYTEEELAVLRFEWCTEMMPDASAFQELNIEMENLVEIYEANDGEGYAITALGQGHSDLVPMIVILDAEGAVVQVKQFEAVPSEDTADFVGNEDFFAQFVGLTEEVDMDDIDVVSGETESSTAVIEAVNVALAAFAQVA